MANEFFIQEDPGLARKRALALAMMQGAGTGPVRTGMEGLARLAKQLVGGYQMGQANREGEERERDIAQSVRMSGSTDELVKALAGIGEGRSAANLKAQQIQSEEAAAAKVAQAEATAAAQARGRQSVGAPPAQPTTAMQNTAALGHKPGTPEYKEALRRQVFQQKTNPNMSGGIEKFVIESNEKAEASSAAAQNYTQLASDLEAAAPGLAGGSREAVKEAFKTIVGDEDQYTLIRKRWQNLRVSSAIKNLPPGVASDKDIALVMSSTLGQHADPGTIAQYLRGMAKMEDLNAKYNEFAAEYVYGNNNSLKGLRPAWRQYAEENKDDWGFGERPQLPEGFQPIPGLSEEESLELWRLENE